LRELRVLHALLQQRSITRTAQAVDTTQPSISKTLRRLRRQFSDPLFVRDGQAMQPTARALDMADRLGVLLAAATVSGPMRSDSTRRTRSERSACS
jgi:DNA-binding transcriptional LysR family regulator